MKNRFGKIILAIIVTSLLASMAFLMFTSSRGDSATTDESTHIAAGYLANLDGDYNINTEHPFLAKKINALPLLLINLNLDRQEPYFSVKPDYYYDSWRESRQLGNDLLYKMSNDADRILRAVRTVPMILALVFALLFFIIAAQLFGLAAGILALVFWTFSPDILAHSRLANTDLWMTVFYFLSVVSFGAYLAKPNYPRLLLAALVLGLALSIKFSSLTLLPVFVILWLIKKWLNNKKRKNSLDSRYSSSLSGTKSSNKSSRPDDRRGSNNISFAKNFLLILKTSFLPALVFLIVSWIVLWANYGFSSWTPPIYEQKLEEHYYSKALVKSQTIARYFKPAEYYKGLAILSANAVGGRPSYLLGEAKYGGWWYYFPVAFAVKTPLPILILLLGSIIFYCKIKKKLAFNDYLLITPIIIYFFLSMMQKLNIGVRHLLPITPFIFLWLAKFMVEFYHYYKNHKLRIFLVTCYMILVTWLIIGTIRIYPHFLSYFNELVGPKNGTRVLTDSNIDWGQDIKRLKTWLDQQKISEPILLEYFWDGEEAIRYYGINYQKLKPNDANQNGYIAVGVSALQSPEFSWLKNHQPIAQIGYSINIYKI